MPANAIGPPSLRERQHDAAERVDDDPEGEHTEDRELGGVGEALAHLRVVGGVAGGPLAPRLQHPLGRGGDEHDDAEHEHDRVGDEADDDKGAAERSHRRPQARPRRPLRRGGVGERRRVHRRHVGVAGVQVDRRQHEEGDGGADQAHRAERPAVGDAVERRRQGRQHGRPDQQPGPGGEHHGFDLVRSLATLALSTRSTRDGAGLPAGTEEFRLVDRPSRLDQKVGGSGGGLCPPHPPPGGRCHLDVAHLDTYTISHSAEKATVRTYQ